MNNKNHNNPGNDVDNLIRQREFGDRFRVAREAAALTTADVADELRLAEDIIKALENSQLDFLPAPTFTQGYIRSYAKMLKLPVDEILKAYDRLIPEKDAPLTVRSALSAQKDSNDKGIKLITFGLFFAALILLVLWFLQTDFSFINGDNVTEIDTESEQAIASELSAENEFLSPQQTSDSAVVWITESEITDQQAGSAEVIAESDVIEAVSEPVVSAVEPSVIEQSSGAESAPRPAVVEAAKISDAKPDQTITKKKPLVTQPVVGNDVLVLATDDESWAEVEDANGARLYFDLMKKDREYKLRGQAPFMLFLGNAPAVTLGVNNQLLNISAYVRRNNIAHIQISENGAISAIRGRVSMNQPGSSDNESSSQTPEAAETTENLQPALENE
ncbi:MAG: RodZ domain-containing protein [Gammaproteobacteria bacterium]